MNKDFVPENPGPMPSLTPRPTQADGAVFLVDSDQAALEALTAFFVSYHNGTDGLTAIRACLQAAQARALKDWENGGG